MKPISTTDYSDAIERIATAIATAQREAAGAVVEAVENLGCEVLDAYKTTECVHQVCYMGRVALEEAKKAAEQFMV